MDETIEQRESEQTTAINVFGVLTRVAHTQSHSYTQSNLYTDAHTSETRILAPSFFIGTAIRHEVVIPTKEEEK